MAPAPPKNGSAWAVGALKWVIIAAVGYLIAVNTWLVQGQFLVSAQGETNTESIKRIDTTLSARAREERASMLRRIEELQAQQRQERATREPSGTVGPSEE